MNPHFLKQIQKINSLINTAKQISYTSVDSLGLISQNISRSKIQSKTSSSKKRSSSIKSIVIQAKQHIPKQYQVFLGQLYESKCNDMKIQHNQQNWRAFLKAFLFKNKKDDQIIADELNLNDFNLQESSMKHINKVLRQNERIVILKLSKNLLNPNKIIRLQTIKVLILNNCKLGNQALQDLFIKLHQSVIERISLSSPQIKNRNTLTRYDKLISLIQTSLTLTTLEISNIEIHPDNQILQSSKNTALKVIDLSDNTNVKGISPTITSLNLSRNNIVHPFSMPLHPSEVEYLNLSYNKIPYFHFKQFLKVLYFPRLSHLVLDHIKLNGDILSIQFFLQQSIRMTNLSMVDCDLSIQSFSNVANGIKSSKSLKIVDLTRNRVFNEKIADILSNMLQNTNITQLKMRHCDIKDHLGKIIFKNIRKNKYIEKIDMMNNLLGDQTSKTICQELKYTKNIICLQLQENIVKYKSMQQIMGFLQGNKYYNIRSLENDFKKLSVLNKQVLQSQMIINSQNQRLTKLQKETAKLQEEYIQKYKKQNKLKKDKLQDEINNLRQQQNDIFQQISLRQTYLDSSLNVTSLGIQEQTTHN